MEDNYLDNPLYEKILTKVLSRYKMKIEFVGLDCNVSEIVELECYRAMRKIDSILNDAHLSAEQKCDKIGNYLHFFCTKYEFLAE